MAGLSTVSWEVALSTKVMQRQGPPSSSTKRVPPWVVRRMFKVSRRGSPPRARIFSRKNSVTPVMFSMMSWGEGNT